MPCQLLCQLEFVLTDRRACRSHNSRGPPTLPKGLLIHYGVTGHGTRRRGAVGNYPLITELTWAWFSVDFGGCSIGRVPRSGQVVSERGLISRTLQTPPSTCRSRSKTLLIPTMPTSPS